MRVLLLGMPDIAPYLFSRRWRCPNLGLASIAGNLEGHDVAVADLVCRRNNGRIPQDIEETVRRFKPDIVGLSSMTFQYTTARKAARVVKDTRPDVVTVLGGYHATLLQDEVTAEDGDLFDFAVAGEGEITFQELCRSLEGHGSVENIKGLAWKKDDRFIINERRPNQDLSELKAPDRTHRVWRDFHYFGRRLDIFETSRGCTLACNFCSMRHMYGPTFRKYSIERVINDLKNAEAVGSTQLIFADDNLTLDPEFFMEICDAIVDAGLNRRMSYIVQVSCAGIAKNPQLVRKMAAANVWCVFLGIENVSKRNLQTMKKASSADIAATAVKLLHDNGILIMGGMIIGVPDDTPEDIQENFQWFYDHEVDFYADQVVTPYPRTQMREEMIEAGLVVNKDDYSKYNGFWANVRTNTMEPDEIQRLKWKLDHKYRAMTDTTRHFPREYRWAALAGKLIGRVRKLRNSITCRGKSERQLFDEYMEGCRRLNVYFPE